MAAERVALAAARTGRRAPSGRSAGCRAASAPGARRRGSGSRPPRAAGRGRRARRGRAAASSPSRSRTSSRSMPARSAGSTRRPTSCVLQPVHRLEPGDLGEGAVEPERLVAAERHPVAEAAGQQLVQVRGELGEVTSEPVVAEERVHHRLRARRAAPGVIERSSDCIAAIRSASCSMMSSSVRAPGKNRAVLGEELRRRPGSLAAEPLAEELVEVADHLAVRGEVLRASSTGSPRDMPATNWSSTCLPEPLDQLVEPLARVRLQEVVLAAARGSARRRRAAARRAGRAAWRRRRGASAEPESPASAPASRRRRRRSRAALSPWRRRAGARPRPAPAATISSSSRRMSPRTSPSWYRSSSSSRRRARRSIRSRRPARSPRVGSPVRQPRSISRRSASARSPSAMTSSASASRISSASRSATVAGCRPSGSSGPRGRARRPSAVAAAAPDRRAPGSGLRGRADPGEYAVTGGRPSRRRRGPC